MAHPSHPYYELERKRPIFFTLGLLSAACAILVAFEWKSPMSQDIQLDSLELEIPIVEPDRQAVKIERAKTKTAEPKSSSAQGQRLKISEREPAPVSMVKTKSVPLAKPKASLAGTSLNLPKSLSSPISNVHQLEMQELPYFTVCADIDDAEERFACTQAKLRQHLKEQIKMPSAEAVPELPGPVQIIFIIDEYGYVGDVEFNKDMDEELEAAIRKSFAQLPPMVPGGSEQRKVKVRFIQPLQLMRR